MMVISSLGIGGAQKHVFELVRQIDRSRFKPFVVACEIPESPEHRYYPDRLNKLGISVHNLDVQSRRHIILRFPRFVRYVRNVDPDVLHVFLYYPSLYGCLSKLILGSRAPRVILLKRSLEVSLRPDERAMYRHILMPVSDIVTAVSEPVRQRCLELGASPSKVTVIENGIEPIHTPPTGKLRRLLGVADGTMLIGTVGSLTVRKGQKHFLRAGSLLLRDFPEAHLVLISDGTLRREIEAEGRRLGIENRLHLPGYLLPATDYIADLSVFVLPSAEEGMSNALLEAMTMGLLCIASDIPSNRQVITHGRDGVLVNVEDHEAFAESMGTLLAHSNRRRSLGEAARETIRQRFDPRHVIMANEALYAALADKRRRKWRPSAQAQETLVEPRMKA